MPLDHDSLAMREYHLAKRRHWDPRELDLSLDREQWATLDDHRRAGLLQLCTLFLAGEEAVTHDLAPLLIGVRRRGGPLEDEIFLATQLYEEAKHAEFFDRWLSEVSGPVPREGELTPSYVTLFYELLPAHLAACLDDHTPHTLARASATYHIIIEGVMAETGYHTFANSIEREGLFPGLLAGVHRVQQDEARHIAFGLDLITRLIGEEPAIRPDVMATLEQGLTLATASLVEAFARWGDDVPFGLDPNEVVGYAARQFSKRLALLNRGGPIG